MAQLGATVARPDAVNEILNLYYRFLYRTARRLRLPVDKVDDVVSRVVANLLVSLPKFRYDARKGKFRGYLKTCVRHAFLKEIEEEAKQPQNGIDPDALARLAAREGGYDTVESGMRREELIQAYHLAMQSFNEDHRQVVRLALIDGMPPAEVARLSGFSLDNVYQVVSRARKKLRDILRGFDDDDSDHPGPWGHPQ